MIVCRQGDICCKSHFLVLCEVELESGVEVEVDGGCLALGGRDAMRSFKNFLLDASFLR